MFAAAAAEHRHSPEVLTVEKTTVLSEAEERIRQMEARFDRLLTLAEQSPAKVPLQEDYEILLEYYQGGQWLHDYRLDEQGLLPPELKRGILSEDGFWNFLELCR